MGEIYPMPRLGDVFDDVRDNGRTMRISCHTERGAVVVSLWHDTLCRGSFRLAAADLDRFISTLAEMNTSLRVVPADATVPVGPDAGSGAPPAGVAVPATATDEEEPPREDTGTVNLARPRVVPVPRVA